MSETYFGNKNNENSTPTYFSVICMYVYVWMCLIDYTRKGLGLDASTQLTS